MPMPLEFVDAARTYGTGNTSVHALLPTTISVSSSELVAIMGPSGSGKSTLLLLAGGLDAPTSGRVLVGGRDIAKLNLRQRSKMRRQTLGYVFQEFNLLPGLTALENVALPMELEGHRREECLAAAHQALQQVELADLAERFPDQMSGGQQQRVAIARAFVGQRELLLADEPTGALDSTTGELVMRILRKHCDNGCAALIATHNSEHAAWADRVIFLRDGRIVGQAAGAEEVHPVNSNECQ